MDAKDAYIEQLEIPIPEITYLSFPTYYFLLYHIDNSIILMKQNHHDVY